MVNSTSQARADGPIGDPEAIHRLLKWGGEPLVREMTALFATQVPRLLAAARDAAAHGDWPSVARDAHSLRGSCAQMGSLRMSDICREVEMLATGPDPMSVLSLLDVLDGEFVSFTTWLDNFGNKSTRSDDQ